MKSAFLWIALGLSGWLGAADRIPMVRVGGQVQAVHRDRIHIWDPATKTWRLRNPAEPSMAEANLGPILREFWDGTWAVRVQRIQGTYRTAAQPGFMEQTPTGPRWFWRPPVDLPDLSRVLAYFEGRLLLRMDRDPGPSVKSQGKPRVELAWLDPLNGSIDLIESVPYSPRGMQFVSILVDGDLLVLSNRGHLWRAKAGGRSFSTIRVNLWEGIEPPVISVESQEFGAPEMAPDFSSYPCFDQDGSILFPITGLIPSMHSKAEMEALWPRLNKRRQEELKALGTFPFKKEEYQGGDRAFRVVRLELDPLKASLLEPGRYSGLVGQDPEHGKPLPVLKEDLGDLAVAADGSLRSAYEVLDHKPEPVKPTTKTDKEISKPLPSRSKT